VQKYSRDDLLVAGDDIKAEAFSCVNTRARVSGERRCRDGPPRGLDAGGNGITSCGRKRRDPLGPGAMPDLGFCRSGMIEFVRICSALRHIEAKLERSSCHGIMFRRRGSCTPSVFFSDRRGSREIVGLGLRSWAFLLITGVLLFSFRCCLVWQYLYLSAAANDMAPVTAPN